MTTNYMLRLEGGGVTLDLCCHGNRAHGAWWLECQCTCICTFVHVQVFVCVHMCEYWSVSVASKLINSCDQYRHETCSHLKCAAKAAVDQVESNVYFWSFSKASAVQAHVFKPISCMGGLSVLPEHLKVALFHVATLFEVQTAKQEMGNSKLLYIRGEVGSYQVVRNRGEFFSL